MLSAAAGPPASDFLDVFDDDVDANEADNFPAFVDGVDDVLGNSLGPFAVSRKTTVLAALEAAGVGSSDVVLDIGSGDGRFCVAAVQRFGALHAVGVELDPQLTDLAIALATRCGVSDRVTFLAADFTAVKSLCELMPPSIAAADAATSTKASPCTADAPPSTSNSAHEAQTSLTPDVLPGSTQQPKSAVPTRTSSSECAVLSGVLQHSSRGTSICKRETSSAEATLPSPSAQASKITSAACGGFTVAVVYLLPGSEERFSCHLTSLFDSNARIVAIHFPIPRLNTIASGGNYYIYQRIPASGPAMQSI